ncbi:MAG: hypothetical protein WAL95_04905 [Candidatus Acidiferrales bacterium]
MEMNALAKASMQIVMDRKNSPAVVGGDETRLLALANQRDTLWQALKTLFPRVDMSLARGEGEQKIIVWSEQPDAAVRDEGTKLTLQLNEAEEELAALRNELGIEKFVPTPEQLSIRNSTTATEMWKRGAADWQRPGWK